MIEPKNIEAVRINIPAVDLTSPTFCSTWYVTPHEAVMVDGSLDELIDCVKPTLHRHVLEEISRWESDFLKKPYIRNVVFIHENHIAWEDDRKKVIKCTARTKVRAIDGHLIRENEPFTAEIMIP